MCLSKPKKPKLQPIKPEPEAPRAMASPEESETDPLRKATSRRSLRIDLGGMTGGSGLNVPQG